MYLTATGSLGSITLPGSNLDLLDDFKDCMACKVGNHEIIFFVKCIGRCNYIGYDSGITTGNAGVVAEFW